MQPRLFNEKEFQIDLKSGFLPAKPPLTQLPILSRLNARINEIGQQLPHLLSTKQLRTTVDLLNEQFEETQLTIDLQDNREQEVAFLYLTMIAQAYIWEDP